MKLQYANMMRIFIGIKTRLKTDNDIWKINGDKCLIAYVRTLNCSKRARAHM